jgi:chemotaxis protein methyltransferase CheR
MQELRPSEFKKFSEMVHEHSGIHLESIKTEILRSRLAKRMRTLAVTSFHEYYERVVEDRTGEELTRMLDVITTNKTEFFRENKHFIFMVQSLLPALFKETLKRQDRTLRVWSAACSSGEEVYTLAMCLKEAARGSDVKVKVLGTDLSSRMIHRATEGVYDQERTSTIPPVLLHQYFETIGQGSERTYRVGPELREHVHFRRFNLNGGAFPFRNPFDVIFCRNVMIYFSQATQQDLVGRLTRVLRPGGYLFTGLSESLLAIKHNLKNVAASVYQKPTA